MDRVEGIGAWSDQQQCQPAKSRDWKPCFDGNDDIDEDGDGGNDGAYDDGDSEDCAVTSSANLASMVMMALVMMIKPIYI